MEQQPPQQLILMKYNMTAKTTDIFRVGDAGRLVRISDEILAELETKPDETIMLLLNRLREVSRECDDGNGYEADANEAPMLFHAIYAEWQKVYDRYRTQEEWEQLVQEGKAAFTGNQHAQSWKRVNSLDELPKDQREAFEARQRAGQVDLPDFSGTGHTFWGDADEHAEQDDITAQHFLPDKPDWDAEGDLRARIAKELGGHKIAQPRNIHYHLEPEPGERRPNFGQLVADWHHFNINGVLTADMFHEHLTGGIKNFVDQIKQHSDEFNPMRFQVNPGTKYGLAYHDWFGEPYKFDIRVLIQFGNFAPEPGLVSPGFHFFITTLLAYDLAAEDVVEVGTARMADVPTS